MLNNLESIANQIRKDLSIKDEAREKMLPLCRDSIRYSSNAIRAVHRQEFQLAKELLQSARVLLSEAEETVRTCSELSGTGVVRDAQKELAEAKSLKQQVDTYELSEFATEEYQLAEKSLQDGEAAYGTDNAAAKRALDAAIQSYNTVMAKAFPLKVDRSQSEVDTLKSSAEDLKAQVALKAEYGAAKAKYDEAVAAKDAGNYEQAVSLFAEAKTAFQDVVAKTEQKKKKAEEALKTSQDGLKDAEEKAKAADEEMKGGSS